MAKLANVKATCIKVDNGVRITVTADADSATTCHYYRLVVESHRTTQKGRAAHATEDGTLKIPSVSWIISSKKCPEKIERVALEEDQKEVDSVADVPVEAQ